MHQVSAKRGQQRGGGQDSCRDKSPADHPRLSRRRRPDDAHEPDKTRRQHRNRRDGFQQANGSEPIDEQRGADGDHAGGGTLPRRRRPAGKADDSVHEYDAHHEYRGERRRSGLRLARPREINAGGRFGIELSVPSSRRGRDLCPIRPNTIPTVVSAEHRAGDPSAKRGTAAADPERWSIGRPTLYSVLSSQRTILTASDSGSSIRGCKCREHQENASPHANRERLPVALAFDGNRIVSPQNWHASRFRAVRPRRSPSDHRRFR
jgi:hypothetical protein